ncbi:MAG: lipid A export permease/ATP-binding protein MsbA [Desulfobacteraceae bacterium]|nr:MAG: lipid A export permease/ATP-binding protein MsbA [Desulfobacteraceae bacterium]
MILPARFIRNRHRQLFQLIKENRYRLIFGALCSMLVAASTSATAWLMKPAIDEVFVRQDTGMLKIIPLAVVALFLLRGLGYYGQEYMMSFVGQGIIKRLRESLYVHIQDLPFSFFNEERTGALMSRITNDVNIMRAMVSTAVTGLMRDALTIIGLTFVILYMDWKLALLAFVVLPLAFYPVVEFGRRVRKVSTGCQESMADLSAFLHETIAGQKIVKAFGMESYEKERFFQRTDRLFRLEMRAVVAKSLTSPIMEFLGGVGVALIIGYGGYRVTAGTSTPGTFFAFIGAVIMMYDPVKKLSRINATIQEGLSAADRVFDIIERQSDIKQDANPVVLPVAPHRVTFEHVYFRYSQEMVLKDINLDVRAGEILAIVGTSGGGKTTLVNLIPRFYDVSEGSIRIDGLDIRRASIESLRRQIAIVTQDPILFNDTVRNNIAYGKPAASESEIVQAAKAAYAYDFIESFPEKFETNIGELGGRLSGGEKQRICIARALIKDAPILILDEATSSLDSESEMLVQKALENLMRGRTTFIIAHRLSTVVYADRIVVISNGRIAEEGTHSELLSCKGEYCRLYQMQFSNGNGRVEASLFT